MSDQRQAALEYACQNKERSLRSLEAFLRIPSVSTESARRPDVQRAAAWVAAQLTGLGMQNVEIYPTAQPPVVYAEWLRARGAPYAGCQRPAFWLYRRGVEDRHPSLGDGEDLHAPRP